jgi:DNA-binding MarR family transcriptional regulator
MARLSARPSELPLDEALDFLRALWRIEHGLQSASKRMEIKLGLTGPQRLVLRILREHPGLTAADLSSVVRLHASTVTGILQRLERKALVSRHRDPEDNRRVRLQVAPKARKLASQRKGTVEAAVEDALLRQSPADVEAAHRVLSAIALTLEVSEA